MSHTIDHYSCSYFCKLAQVTHFLHAAVALFTCDISKCALKVVVYERAQPHKVQQHTQSSLLLTMMSVCSAFGCRTLFSFQRRSGPAAASHRCEVWSRVSARVPVLLHWTSTST